MKPFNLEEAKAGKPVVTRDGKKARILCLDRKNSRACIIAAVDNGENCEESILSYNEKGQNIFGFTRPQDLMMAPVERTLYVNVYHRVGQTCFKTGIALYASEAEAAREASEECGTHIATVPVTFTE